MYLVVGFLCFPVSFLQKDISVFSEPQLIGKDVIAQGKADKRISRISESDPDHPQGPGGAAWAVEIEEPDFHSHFPHAIFLPEILSSVTIITSSTYVEFHTLPR